MNNKKLYRNKKDKKIGGVCSGLAEYLNVDVVVVRLLALFALFFFMGGLMYIIGIFIIPENPNEFL